MYLEYLQRTESIDSFPPLNDGKQNQNMHMKLKIFKIQKLFTQSQNQPTTLISEKTTRSTNSAQRDKSLQVRAKLFRFTFLTRLPISDSGSKGREKKRKEANRQVAYCTYIVSRRGRGEAFELFGNWNTIYPPPFF